MTLVALLYAVVACGLAAYGINALVLTVLSLRRRAPAPAADEIAERELPAVTVQLPIYNEKYVASRLIDAVCALEYPRDRLEVQVLDDSTDETRELIAHRVRLWARRGTRIVHVRRADRREFKAGALGEGLARASGEWIAIFDADFVPPPDWLRRVVARAMAGERDGDPRPVGLVQSRWEHLNADYSPLTGVQALALDGHFGVEQVARARGGLLLNFNGTAGLWRRDCIVAGGGWSGETLCEDLDLSIRAQLAGWRLLYDPAIVAPAEIPAQISSFKRQQFRWAKGSIQVARLRVRELVAARLGIGRTLLALLHLTGYLVHPLMVLLLLLSLPLALWGWPSGTASQQGLLAWVGLAGLGAPLLYAVAQARLRGTGGLARYRWMPLLVLLGSGVALSNSRAVLEGLFGARGGEFRRTPKFRLEGRRGEWSGSSYTLGLDPTTAGELFLALHALVCAVALWRQGAWLAIPFMALYVLAFGGVAGLSLWQARAGVPARRAPRPRVPAE